MATAAFLGPVAGDAWGWTAATKIAGNTDAAGGGVAGGTYAEPDGRFFVASGKGYATGQVGDAFALAPFPVPVGPNQQAFAPPSAVFSASGAGFAVWYANGFHLGSLSAGGTITSPEGLTGGAQLVADSAGHATLAYTKNNALWIAHRNIGDAAFTDDPSPVVSAGGITTVGLAVDPDGAAVVTWLQGGVLRQAVRSAGATTFGAPGTDISASNDVQFARFSTNAAGRAVVVYLTSDSHYHAAGRVAGGAFGSATDLGSTATSGPPQNINLPQFAQIGAGVSADGDAEVLVTTTTPLSCYIPPPQNSPPTDHGWAYGLQDYHLAPGAASFTHANSFGGAGGNSATAPTVAGGPGSRLDAAWSVDQRSEADRCVYGHTAPYDVLAGRISPTPSIAEIFADNPSTPNNSYAPGESPVPAPKLALNSCGDGVLLFGVALSAYSDPDYGTHPEDGIYISRSISGDCAASPGGGTPPPGPGQPGPGPPGGGDPGGQQVAEDAAVRAAALKWLLASIAAAQKAAKTAFDDPNTSRFGFRVVSTGGGGKFVVSLLAPQQSQTAKMAAAKQAKKKVVLASGKKTFTGAGAQKVTVEVTAAGRRLLLAAARHHRKLNLVLSETFTPTVGARHLPPVSTRRSLTLHPKVRRRKHH